MGTVVVTEIPISSFCNFLIGEGVGSGFLKRLNLDFKMQMPEAECFSVTNLKYMRCFWQVYAPVAIGPQVGDSISPQVGEELDSPIFHVPWGHHKYIIDKLRKYPDKMTTPASRRSSPKSRRTSCNPLADCVGVRGRPQSWPQSWPKS